MLALLNELKRILGNRNYLAMVLIASIGIIVFEYSNVFRNYFETYIQKQNATYADQKAKGEAEQLTAAAREKEFQAQLAAEVAANAKFRQDAEAQLAGAAAREKEAQAQLAAEVAANAKFRQAAEAQLAGAAAREKEAMAVNAAAVAKNSDELQLALANKAREEGRKAAAEADLAAANAAKEAVIAKAFNPNFRTSQEAAAAPEGSGETQPPKDIGRALYEQNLRVADNLLGPDSITYGVGYAKETPTNAAPPPATTQSAKTPPAFDCNKASLGVEYVICSSPQLMDAEARLEDAYRAARAVRGDDEIKYQHAWYTKTFGQSCRLPAKGQPSPAVIRASQNCVAQAMSERIHALETVTTQGQAQ